MDSEGIGGAISTALAFNTRMGADDRVQAEDAASWRAWLAKHAETSSGVWLVTWKRASGKPVLSYEDSVVEALAYGWVDSKGQRLDDDRTMLWFTTRKVTSGWSRPNKERIARLEAEGRITERGRRAVEIAKENGAWTLLDDVENLIVPDDLAAAFARHPGSADQFEGFPRSARRGILEWIVQAKRPATRAQRIEQTAELAARGERAAQWSRKTEPQP